MPELFNFSKIIPLAVEKHKPINVAIRRMFVRLQMYVSAAWPNIYFYSITLSNIPITLKVFSYIEFGSITIS
jgi:hypothetical protein